MATAKKAKDAILTKPKKDGKPYTKSQLISHLAEVISNQGHGDISKKQAAAFVEEYAKVALNYAPVGAVIPGLGKLVVRKTPARPKRKGRNPATGEEMMIPAKKAGQKLVFRVAKVAKEVHDR